MQFTHFNLHNGTLSQDLAVTVHQSINQVLSRTDKKIAIVTNVYDYRLGFWIRLQPNW